MIHADGCFLFLKEDYYLSNNKFRIKCNHNYIKGVFYTKQFESVSFLKDYYYRIKGLITGSYSALFPSLCCFFKSMPVKMPRFSCIICSKYDSDLVDMYSKAYNISPKVYLIEDGTGDYTISHDWINPNYTKIFYWPELYNKFFSTTILQAPICPQNNALFCELLFNVFRYNCAERNSGKKCIFFHQPIDNCLDKTERKIIVDMENSLIKVLSTKFGKDFFIKLHPRDDLNCYSEYNILDSSVPWEVMITQNGNIDDYLLVGINSTALITPKLVFDYEPSLLILEKVFKYWEVGAKKHTVERTYILFEELRNTYRVPEKVQIPDSYAELYEIIKN